jgi:hypothetical protein
VQTLYPDHYSVQLACRQDYPAFFDRELDFRRKMHYPPMVSMINIIVRSRTFSGAMDDAAGIAQRLRGDAERSGLRVLGPAPAPLGRLRANTGPASHQGLASEADEERSWQPSPRGPNFSGAWWLTSIPSACFSESHMPFC